jgi:hypothetical protein
MPIESNNPVKRQLAKIAMTLEKPRRIVTSELLTFRLS